MLGHWKNIEELELSLNVDELNAIVEASRDQEQARQRFAAALKGIKLDEERAESASDFEAIKKKAAAIAAGLSPEDYDNVEERHVFGEIGIEVTEE